MIQSKGQFSTFLKPIVILIFSSLLIALLATSLNFNIGVSEDEKDIDFQSQPKESFQDLASCLSTSSSEETGKYVLNQTLLEQMEMNYRYREPRCAENFKYGYEAEISQDFLTGFRPEKSERPTDVVFALDDSGSMGTYLNKVKDNTNEFIKNLPPGSRVGMFTYASPPGSYIQNTVDLTPDASKVTSELAGIGTDGGEEPEDLAIKYAMENFDFRDNRRKIVILLSTEAATKDKATSKHVTEWAHEADSEDITIYPVSGMGGTYNQIADITGGKRFSVTAEYASIFEEIAGKDKKVGGDSTCTIPPVDGYNGSAQVIIASDTSSNFSEEWNTVCGDVKDEIKEMESKGLQVNLSFYAPGTPGTPVNGQGMPMEINGAPYDHRPAHRNVPSCLDSSINSNAVNGGVTFWDSPGLVDYNSSKDYGYEAWGVFSKWILENHGWDQDVDERKLFVIGNQDPTGGNVSPVDFRHNSTPGIIDGEAELVENVAELSDQKNVSIYTAAGDMEYDAKNRYGNPGRNDALELMENLSQETGGQLIEYSNTGKLTSKIKQKFEGLKTTSGSSSTCENLTYQFGEMHGTQDSERVASTFPVTIRHSEDLKTPGTAQIKARNGALEKMAGAINQVTASGKRLNRNTTATVSIENDETLKVGEHDVTRKQPTDYVLKSGGNTDITVKDDLIVGINGRKEFSDRDGTPSTIDFSKSSNHIEGYKGAHLQLIAINSQEPDMKLPELYLACASTASCTGSQKLNSEIEASKGDSQYSKLGGIGPFHHVFTEVEIGNQKTVTEETVCYQETDQCVVLRSNNVDSMELRPGSHQLRIDYSPSTGVSIE